MNKEPHAHSPRSNAAMAILLGDMPLVSQTLSNTAKRKRAIESLVHSILNDDVEVAQVALQEFLDADGDINKLSFPCSFMGMTGQLDLFAFTRIHNAKKVLFFLCDELAPRYPKLPISFVNFIQIMIDLTDPDKPLMNLDEQILWHLFKPKDLQSAQGMLQKFEHSGDSGRFVREMKRVVSAHLAQFENEALLSLQAAQPIRTGGPARARI